MLKMDAFQPEGTEVVLLLGAVYGPPAPVNVTNTIVSCAKAGAWLLNGSLER